MSPANACSLSIQEMKPDLRVVKQISVVLDEVMSQLNSSASVIQGIPRINEVSSHFEDLMRELLNKTPGLICDFPKTSEGRLQRSGYPDLKLIDQESHRVYCLDPKLYAVGSRDSSFRTFISSQRSRPTKCARTRCISSSVLSMRNQRPTAIGNSHVGIWSTSPISK